MVIGTGKGCVLKRTEWKMLRKQGFFCLLSLLLVVSYSQGALIDTNLLVNSGFEDGLNGWTSNWGGIRNTNPGPYEGLSFYYSGAQANTVLYQPVSLVDAGFTISELNSETLLVHYGGWQAGAVDMSDGGRIGLIFKDDNGQSITSVYLDWYYGDNTWVMREGTAAIPVGTRSLEYNFQGVRTTAVTNDAYLDSAFLKVILPEPSVVLILGVGSLVLLRGRIHRRNRA